MGTEPIASRARTGCWVCGWVVIHALTSIATGGMELAAQDPADLTAREPSGAPLYLIDADTRVASLAFDLGTGYVDVARLESRIAIQDPSATERLRRALDWVPFISSPAPQRFHPMELQRDKVRLTRFYRSEGFPDVEISYEVALDTLENAVDVRFEVQEGAPRILDTIFVVTPPEYGEGRSADLLDRWRSFVSDLLSERGNRLSQVLETRLRSRTLEWWRDHGHAFAEVTSSIDTTSSPQRRLASALRLDVEPGPLTRIGRIEILGNEALSSRTIRRELPFKEGDLFRSSALSEGQNQLFGLDLLRLALVGVPDSQAVDSTVTVRVQLEEGALRTIDGLTGYSSEDGLLADASWSHRDFMGAARRLDVVAQARTGLWSGDPGPNASYSLSTTLRQPWLGDFRVSGLVSPFVEFRDNLRDRSIRTGIDATVLWDRGPLRNMSVSYGFSNRVVSQARGGALTGFSDFVGFLQALDTLDATIRTSGVRYAANWGEVDDPVNPRSGWFARVGAEVSGPAGWANVQYGRVEAGVRGFLPLGVHSALILKAGAGHLMPFGKSVPKGGNETQVFLRLRDGLFTGGGTQDVRGWGADLLGPKVPDIDVQVRGDSAVFGGATRYVPLGGTDRWNGSVELQLPMPWTTGPHSIHGFLDAGRIWTSDERFVDPDEPTLVTLDDHTVFGTGVGVQLGTPVGPLRMSVAYKLNPGLLDLREPGDVAEALLTGSPIEALEADQGRRWQLHLAIGRAF